MRNPGHQGLLWQGLLRWLQPSMARAHQEIGFRPGKGGWAGLGPASSQTTHKCNPPYFYDF